MSGAKKVELLNKRGKRGILNRIVCRVLSAVGHEAIQHSQGCQHLFVSPLRHLAFVQQIEQVLSNFLAAQLGRTAVIVQGEAGHVVYIETNGFGGQTTQFQSGNHLLRNGVMGPSPGEETMKRNTVRQIDSRTWKMRLFRSFAAREKR